MRGSPAALGCPGMSIRTLLALSSLALVAARVLVGCQDHRDPGPIEVSVVGAAIDGVRANADRGPLDAPAAALIGATGQGLVRFDSAGQIVPGLAARWAVSDAGRSLLFRLPDVPPSGRAPIDANLVARRLRAAIAPASRNPLKPLLGAIDEVTAVTPQVIDVELKAPRPDLLRLFAQPALALSGGRVGPFAIRSFRNGVVTLRLLPAPDRDPDEAEAMRPADIRLRGEPAGRAVARFVAGRSGLLLGGSFADLPIAHVAALPDGVLRLDPVKGLFGLAFVAGGTGFTADIDNRRALAMAIDRDRIARLLGVPGWTPSPALVAPGTPEVPTPVTPAWSTMPLGERQGAAAQIVARHPVGPPLRVAMPPGPGARALFAAIAADWHAIGVAAVAVGAGDPADLWLIDRVAPADVASFYLRAFACDEQVPCTPESDQMLIAARVAPTLAARAALLQQADALITQTTAFIAFGPPIRWSLVAPNLDLYRDSPRAVHPLNELRSPLKR